MGGYEAASTVLERVIDASKSLIDKYRVKGTAQHIDIQDEDRREKEARSNYFLLQDSHILLAQCQWRLLQPLEAVKNFKLA